MTQSGKGKGNALTCGFWAATGDIIVMLDADGSTDPAEIPRFVAALLAGADFAKGTRFTAGGGSADITTIRRIGNWALAKVVNRIWGGQYSDLCYGYNAFWRRCLPFITPDCEGFEVETLINIRAARAELRIHEVPSFEYDRRAVSAISTRAAMASECSGRYFRSASAHRRAIPRCGLPSHCSYDDHFAIRSAIPGRARQGEIAWLIG
jgi:glycosyltransferase involved in cell wall biosynthesis